MLNYLSSALLIFSLWFTPQLHAEPADGRQSSADDLDRLLADKGLRTPLLENIRHNMNDKAAELVVNAMGFLGVPYKRGGNSAETGFDCSGFVRSLYAQTVGLLLPRQAAQQAAATQSIDKSELQPGDLVFFNTMRRAFSHVGIYIGEGKFIHSPRSGAHVRIENMGVAYWKTRFDGARRVYDNSPVPAIDTPYPSSSATDLPQELLGR